MPTPEEIRRYEKKAASKMLKGSREPGRVKNALVKFYSSLDRNMQAVVKANAIGIECGEGCSYCCYLKVDTHAHEVFLISDYIKQNFMPDEIEALKVRLQNNANTIRPLTREQHWVTNVQCALLVNDRCSVYSVRPALCRKFHSWSVDLCRQSHEAPDDPTIPSSEDVTLNISAREAILGFHDAIKKVRLDSETYDINSALFYALNDSAFESEWRKGKKAFPEDAESKK